MAEKRTQRVIIVGGGFGGLYTAKGLAGTDLDVLLIDKKNHHTFQPLLYQVATAVLSPGEIAQPLRRILGSAANIAVIMDEVIGFDLERSLVKLQSGGVESYDYLVVAAGARHSYFGHDQWERFAPGLKTIEDAIEIRKRILLAFELAERTANRSGSYQPLHFAVIGGGPTGVELAGAIAEIAVRALVKDFTRVNTLNTKVSLFEASSQILGMYPEELSLAAERQLRELGVEIHKGVPVTDIKCGRIQLQDQWLPVTMAIWTTGVAASPLGRELGAKTDRAGRVHVSLDLSLPMYRKVFVIGDMAAIEAPNGKPVPALADSAIQEAQTVVANILADQRGRERTAFKYKDRGNMATIGRNRAIARIGNRQLSGWSAWLLWALVHILLIIGFRNRLAVFGAWIWAYFTRERSARLITGDTGDFGCIISGPENGDGDGDGEVILFGGRPAFYSSTTRNPTKGDK
jgi:NADH:ubiquinone reductase (H+-translocating)